MKKFLVSMIIISVFFNTSCDKDDNGDNGPVTLQGKWKLTETLSTDVYNTDEQNSTWQTVPENESYELELTADSQFVSYKIDPPCRGTYTVKDENTVEIAAPCFSEGFDPIYPPRISFSEQHLLVSNRAGDEGTFIRKFTKVD